MPFDVYNPNHRDRLSRAVRHWRVETAESRSERRELTALVRDESTERRLPQYSGEKSMLNLIQQQVIAHVVNLSWRGPKFSITAKRWGANGKAFAKRIQAFLNAYSVMIDLSAISEQVALDSAFGWGITKVGHGPAPKGVYGIQLAPRCWRVDPFQFLYDGTATKVEDALYLGDVYLTALDDARVNPYFNPRVANRLALWGGTGTREPDQTDQPNYYAMDMTRLVDIYLPSAGVIATWPCTSDEYSDITQEPLSVRTADFNPYDIMSTQDSPDKLHELASGSYTKELHYLANDMAKKMATQARQGKRNPIFEIGHGPDADTLRAAKEGDPIGLTDKTKLDMFVTPGADPSVISILGQTIGLFKEAAGNIDLQLGLNQTADTARQAALQNDKVGARTGVTSRRFEDHMASVGKKLASLAFKIDGLELELLEQPPGMPWLTLNRSWGKNFPSVGVVNDYSFDVVAHSMSYRSPEARLQQLEAASQSFFQFMTLAAQGAPVNLEAVLNTIAEYRELPEILEWWSGESPQPPAQGPGTGIGTINQGSDVRYSGGLQGGGAPAVGSDPPAAGLIGAVQGAQDG